MSHNAQEMYEALKAGYTEMGDINTELAEEGVCADSEAFSVCERRLTECE